MQRNKWVCWCKREVGLLMQRKRLQQVALAAASLSLLLIGFWPANQVGVRRCCSFWNICEWTATTYFSIYQQEKYNANNDNVQRREGSGQSQCGMKALRRGGNSSSFPLFIFLFLFLVLTLFLVLNLFLLCSRSEGRFILLLWPPQTSIPERN